MKTIRYTLLFFCLLGGALQAQDIHYSQFYNAPMNLNPALTGIYRGDARFAGNYRQQWTPWVHFVTFTGMADMKFYPKAPRPGFFAGGLTFNYDQAGLSKLQLLQLGASASYTRRMSNHSYLTLGAMLSGNQRGFKLGALTFDEQFDPGRGRFDPSRSNGEQNLNTTNYFFDFSAGLNFRLQSLSDNADVDELQKRSKLDLGIGIFHLNRPDQSFFDESKARLLMRFSPYATGTLQLGSSDLDLVANVSAQFQGPYREYLGLMGLNIHLEKTPGRQFSIQPAIGYRFDDFGDAFYPALQGSYNNWRIGLSWDVNVSEARAATRRNGGPEVSVQYIISRPLPKFKICPLI